MKRRLRFGAAFFHFTRITRVSEVSTGESLLVLLQVGNLLPDMVSASAVWLLCQKNLEFGNGPLGMPLPFHRPGSNVVNHSKVRVGNRMNIMSGSNSVVIPLIQ